MLPGSVWLLLFFVVPTVTLVATSLYDPAGSLQLGYQMTVALAELHRTRSQDYGPQFVRSLLYAGIATVACILLGFPLAYAIAFKAGRCKNLMLVAVIAPFFTSFLIRTLSWKLHPRRQRASLVDTAPQPCTSSAPTAACWRRRSRWSPG